MKTVDFSVPQRMSKSAYVIIFFNRLKSYSGFLLFLIVLKFMESKDFSLELVLSILGLMAGILLLTAIDAFINYYYKKFHVQDGYLIFDHGCIRRETSNIPLHKIHSMRTKRGFIYRLLDMKGVSFDTLASKEAEIELILDYSDWEALLGLVKEQECPEEEAAQQKPEKRTSASAATDQHGIHQLKFKNLNLIKGALCQNHFQGMGILGALLFTLYGNITSVNENAINWMITYVENKAAAITFSLTLLSGVVIAVYLIALILWIGQVLLRYFNMDLRIDEKHLFFESGLITRRSARFAHDKVCTVYVKRNFLEKALNCCTLTLKQAFNSTEKEDKGGGDVKIYGSNADSIILNWWLGKDYSLSEKIIEAHSGKALFFYTIRWNILLTLAAILLLCYFNQYFWIAVPVAYLAAMIGKGICAVYHSRITLKEDYLEINTGKYADVLNYVKYGQIEQVQLIRTPFTPYYHRVHLSVQTNGTSFIVRSLKETEATEIFELLLHFCEEAR